MAGAGIAPGRSPLIDEEVARGGVVHLMPHLRMAGSWGHVMRMRPDRPDDAALPALVEFLLEDTMAGSATRRHE